MTWIWLFIGICLLVLRKIFDVCYRKYYNFPSGSVGFPLVGLFFNGLSYPPNFHKLSQIYWPITMYYLGLSKIIHVHDEKIMKQILNKPAFYSNRLSMKHFGWGKVDSFALESGKKWSVRRKLAQSTLFTILNYSYLDQLILNTLKEDIFPRLDNKTDIYYCRDDMRFITLSSIYNATFGKRITINDPKLKSFMNCNDKLAGRLGLNMLFRILFNGVKEYYLSRTFSKIFVNTNYYSTVSAILIQWINEANINDDKSFLSIMLKHVDEDKITFDELLSDFIALFGVGTHGTSSAMEQMILFCTKYRNIQDRVYSELKDHKFDMSKLYTLHTFRAFISESLRWSGIIGSSAPRLVRGNNVKIGQYNIPNNSILICNYKAVNFNAKYWKYPNTFNIENFLDNDNKFKASSHLMSFGYGRRDCMGQTLAMRFLYIIVANLIKNYEFCIPHNVDPQSFEIPKSYMGFNVKHVGIMVKKR